jgi:hypothetical protein
MAGNPHVLSVGVDLAPALDANGVSSQEITAAIQAACTRGGGEAQPPRGAKAALQAVANVLNIAWIDTALERPAHLICPRSSRCPRPDRCAGAKLRPSRAREIDDVRAEILGAPR